MASNEIRSMTNTDLFIKPKNQLYFLSHSVGCLSQAAVEANQIFLQSWQQKGSLAWEDWLTTITQFKNNLALLFNSQAEHFCPTQNVSDALFKIISSLPERNRNKIILSELDFPSVGFVAQSCQRLGYVTQIIPKAQLIEQGLDAYEAAIDEHTQVVITSHSTYGDSRLMPIQDLQALCRQQDVFSIIDVAQSAGIVELDLQKTPADFIVGSCVKWLCGGPGAGFLYVRPSLIPQLSPLPIGWFSHADPLEFDIHHFQFADDAKKFWGGTPNILPFAMASASLATLLEIGIKPITAHNQKLKALILNSFPEQLSFAADAERGGTVTLSVDNVESCLNKLQKNHVQIDHRPGYGLRVSPHIYNTVDEINKLIEILLS